MGERVKGGSRCVSGGMGPWVWGACREVFTDGLY